MVKKGEFREDLYFRLKVFEIDIPPLRKRKEDIPLLVEYLVKKINRTTGKKIRRIPMAVIDRFIEHDWPGNIRELENVLTRAVVLSKDDCLHETNVANLLRRPQPSQPTAFKLKSLSEIEAQHITQVLDYCQWNISQASRILGITRPTLRNKIKSLNLSSGES